MKHNDVIAILGGMKAKFEKDRPAWYANATDEEKTAFEQKNADKIEALDFAMKCVRGYKELERAAEFIRENIIEGEGDGENGKN